MPEFDVVVLVPVKRRINVKDVNTARAHGPAMIGGLVAKQYGCAGIPTLKAIYPVAEPAPAWDETRMDIIGQNGNDGEHY
jgi:hypothetical protein